jgi:hypothetical protein
MIRDHVWLSDVQFAQLKRIGSGFFDQPTSDGEQHASGGGVEHNLANFLRTLALPDDIEKWSLTSLREKLVKIGAKLVVHGRDMAFQIAEVAVPRDLFRRILQMIDGLRPRRMAQCCATRRRRTCQPTGQLRPKTR